MAPIPAFSGIYVGTYTFGTSSEGIYFLSFDQETGQGKAQPAAGLENPSYLLFSPDRRSLYAVSERLEYKGCCGGAAASFSVNWETGALSPTGFSHLWKRSLPFEHRFLRQKAVCLQLYRRHLLGLPSFGRRTAAAHVQGDCPQRKRVWNTGKGGRKSFAAGVGPCALYRTFQG